MVMDNAWLIFGLETIAVTIIGSILHFTYEWSHENKIVAIFSAVNESTWEHIKLALSGIFVCTLVDIWFLGDNPNYWFARSLSFLVPVIVIPVLFYGYRSLSWVKKSILAVDITIFVIAAAASSAVFVWGLNAGNLGVMGSAVSIVTSVVILTAYLLLTKFPLHHNFLFEDPITHKYGYEGHKSRRKNRKIKK